MSLFEQHVGFVAALRGAGLAVSVAEDIDAVVAVRAIELADREQLRAAYAASLVKRQVHRPAFDTVFDLFFPATDVSVDPDREAPVSAYPADPAVVQFRDELRDALLRGDDVRLRQLAQAAVGRFGGVAGRRQGVQSWSRYAALTRIWPGTLMASLLDALLAEQDRDGLTERTVRTTLGGRIARFEQFVDTEVQRRLAAESSPDEIARTAVRPSIERRDLQSATRGDLTAMRREIAPLARRLAARVAIEQRRGRRGPLDFRRTIRASLSAGGVPIETVHRPRRPKKTDLVIVCDVSDSVSAFAQFTLLLIFALREQFTRVRVFAFVDHLDEITALLDPTRDVVDAFTRVASEAKVTGWSGRTDYGRAFGLFTERYLDAITARTSLLILGDARSNYGDVALPALRRMAARARRAYWLNPERRSAWNTGDSCADEVAAAVPMLECRNLAQLSDFVRDLV